MSRSMTQSAFQHLSRQVPTASSADRPGRYPYESGWNIGSTFGSRYFLTTVWAILSATVGTPQDPDPAPARLGYFHHPDRRWEVAPRGHPVPELVQVPFEVPFELRNRLAVDPGCPLVGFDPEIRLPDHIL